MTSTPHRHDAEPSAVLADQTLGAAAFRVGAVGVVWLGGPDRLAYLERMSTNRVADLPLLRGRATAVLTDAGRMVDVVACYQGEEGAVLITTAPEAAAAVAAHLRRYVLYNDDVRVTDASGQVAAIRVLGGAAWAVADAVTAAGIGSATAGAEAGERAGTWRVVEGAGEPIWLLGHVSPGGMDGVDIVVPSDALAAVAERLSPLARELDAAGYDAARVDRLQPRFGAEIDGVPNPLELGLRDLVDFAKGCYIGQEIVARLDTYDRVKRRLVRLASLEPMAVGDAVTAADGSRAGPHGGRVTTVVEVGDGWRALAIAPSSVAALGRGLVHLGSGRSIEVRAAFE